MGTIYTFIYCVYIHKTAISEKRGYVFEREKDGITWERFGKRKWKGFSVIIV